MILGMRKFDPKLRAAFKRYQTQDKKTGDQKKAKQLQQSFERGLTFLGITAVEDTLQDNASRTIARLSQSGLKVWICTGDKYETTLGIAKACELIKNDSRDTLSIIKENYDQITQQI